MSSIGIDLLGGFDLKNDKTSVAVSSGSERLLAFLALHCPTFVPRALVAGTLWPETPEYRAYANLRSALRRMKDAGRCAVEAGPSEMRLAGHVVVDIHRARSLARLVINASVPSEGVDFSSTIETLSADLLPGWYDDWALRDAEDWRQLRLHALETLARDFVAAQRFAEAVTAASAAVRADPLRESSQASLIRAHLAEDNQSEALRVFERYQRRLADELGLRPTPRLRRLMTGLCGAITLEARRI